MEENNLLFIVFYGNASDYLRPFAWLMSIYIHRLESPTFYRDNDEVSRCLGRLCVSVNPILSNPNIIWHKLFCLWETVPRLIFVGLEVLSSCSSRCFNYLTETTTVSDARQQQDAHNAGALIRENPLCLH